MQEAVVGYNKDRKAYVRRMMKELVENGGGCFRDRVRTSDYAKHNRKKGEDFFLFFSNRPGLLLLYWVYYISKCLLNHIQIGDSGYVLVLAK